MRPGVVGQLDLPGIDQRAQDVLILGPRVVDAVDEVGEPHAGVLGELRVESDNLGVDAVIDGQRQQVAIAGQRVEQAVARQPDPSAGRRRRKQVCGTG